MCRYRLFDCIVSGGRFLQHHSGLGAVVLLPLFSGTPAVEHLPTK